MKLTVVQSLAAVSAVGILPEVVEAVLLLKFLLVFVSCFAPFATIFLVCYLPFLLLQLFFSPGILLLESRTRDVHYSSLRSLQRQKQQSDRIYIFRGNFRSLQCFIDFEGILFIVILLTNKFHFRSFLTGSRLKFISNTKKY